jgi:hypothetical protein
MGGMSVKGLGVLGAALAALLLSAPSVGAAEITRDEYRQLVEPICKRNVLANKRIFKGAKGEVKAGKLKLASKHFLRASTAFAGTIRELAAVSQPTADEARLGRWLDQLRTVKDIVRKIGKALAADQKRKAESFSVELDRNTRKANNTVLSFQFDYCRLDPSRFG